MRAGVFSLVLMMGLVPASSSAQNSLNTASLPERPLSSTIRPMRGTRPASLHSASLPERPLTTTIRPTRGDVFRARPETYRPDPNRALPVFGYLGPQLVYPYVQPTIIVVQVPRDAGESARVEPRVPPAPVVPPAPYVAGVPGRPRNFYVIPGCYAGDRPPEPESLAPGCSMTRLRVVPPS